MNSEWPTVSLANAPLAIMDGDRGSNYPSQDDFSSVGHCLFLNTGNVTTDGFAFSICMFISAEKDTVLRKGKLVRGDVVLTTRGTVGNVGLFDRRVKFEHVRINSGMVILRPEQDRLSSYFLYLFLRSELFKAQAKSLKSGSAQPQLPIRDMKCIEIPIPAIQDQVEICNVLGALDDRITLLRETNATLEAIAQALFKSWFVDFDPVHVKQQGRAPEGMDEASAALFPDSFEESELGLVPKGWRVARLDSFVELAYGKALKSTDRTPGDVPVYGSGGITGYHNESLTNGPSVIVGRKGTVGSLYWEDLPFFPIDTVFYVRSAAPMTYCFYLLRTLGLADMNTDAAVPGLNRNNVYRLPVALPSSDVLKAFDDVVKVVRDNIFRNQQQAQTLATLRDTLLPRLISGQLRLPEAETAVEAVL
jgi:type I restriction enzyme S subunit